MKSEDMAHQQKERIEKLRRDLKQANEQWDKALNAISKGDYQLYNQFAFTARKLQRDAMCSAESVESLS